VAILSRESPKDVQLGIPGFADEQKRVIAATVGDLRIVNLYVVNGQTVGSEKYDYKLRWIDAVHGWLSEEIKAHPNMVVLGDFNIAPEDRDVHDPAVWNGDSIHTSTAERAALRRLTDLGLHDSFRLHNAEGGHFSWWDYRAAGFRRNLGLRIDLALISEPLRARAVASSIDREPRLWDRPSDHAPVLVEIAD
jgi:exodeoxyribonuclease-3